MDVIEASGGMLEGHVFKAYQPGGPSSGLLPASVNDVPLDFDTLQPLGTFIGSAAVVVLSDHDSAKDAALNMLRFFEDESIVHSSAQVRAPRDPIRYGDIIQDDEV